MKWRLRSVRTRILLLVLVPVLSLVGIYACAIGTTARAAVGLSKANTVKNAVGDPIAAFMAQLGTERMLAMEYMSAPTGANLAQLELQETKTNQSATALRAALGSGAAMGNASEGEKGAIAGLVRDVGTLPSLRAQIAAQIIPSSRALAEYNSVVQGANRVLSSAIRQQSNADVVAQALAFVRMGQSADLLSQENALLAGGLNGGQFTAADLQQFTQIVGARRAFYTLTLPDLDPQYRAYYTRAISPQSLAELGALENTVITSKPGSVPPVAAATWQQAVGSVATGLTTASTQAASALTSQANAEARAAYVRLFLAAGLGLLAIIVSIVLSVWIGRREIRDLSALRDTALETANERLPDVVTRLAAGEHVDVPAAALPAKGASTDEIGEVREAFARVQQTAVEAAVGQAQLRRGISHIFRNLARRSQSLLHRQLSLLDAMERRSSDPQELEDLFRVDHLATRMRRHAESLIILSGEAPARGWRHPVPLVDVLRAAVAEVEDYTRIKVTATTQASLAGPAVGDVIHMIAELAENATIYSPPQTPVSITGSIVGQGFAVEIEDRGLGMTATQRDEINAQLENPPAFDLSGSDQLGLFVAGQLAKRQNIHISFRPSPYGGTTAIVLIPRSLVVPEGGAARDTSPLLVGSSAQARHAIGGGGHELTGPDGNRSSPAEPALPAAATALRLEPDTGPSWRESPSSWPDTPPSWPGTTVTGPSGTRESTTWAVPPPPPPAHPAQRTPPILGGGTGPNSVIPVPPSPPASPVPAAGGIAEAGGITGAGADDDTLLPRRIRQASLAPQLRDGPARPAPSTDLGIIPESPSPLPERSPEETRDTMSAIQRGWERGRSVFDPASGNGEGTAGPGLAGTGAAAAEVTDATDTMGAVPGEGAADAGSGLDTDVTADPGAGRPEGDATSPDTHPGED
jgi:signal transduction histidine kinase